MAGKNYLVAMADISEVLPLPSLTAVPLTKPWFRGVANVRGNLYCIVDMALYEQSGAASGDTQNRVLLIAERYAFNVALLVDRVLGLRDARTWHQGETDGMIEYQDEQGTLWHTLNIASLLEQPEFLQIGS